MEKRTRRTITQQQSLEKKDVPTELMHRIQSLLSEKEAARTCVLSKSWLHAWSTIPNLRFPSDHNYNKLIYNTIQRYHNHNIPIEALSFNLNVENQELGEIWMRRILAAETRSCLKQLSLIIGGLTLTDSVFTFSDDILFSGENLHTIEVIRETSSYRTKINPSINPVIKCVSLRVLKLSQVNISEDIFHNLLSTCSLLEKVILFDCQGLKTIKVKNHGCLRQLEITSWEEDGLLEIDNVPSLGFFYYKLFWGRKNFLPFKTTDTTASSLGRSVTQLHLHNIIIDDTFFDMIKSKFPFLESLELQIGGWASERLVITSLSLKRLVLWLVWGHRLIDLQVYAPNLLSFHYDGNGKTLPTLLFPTIAPKQIELTLNLENPLIHTSFFLKLREVLNLSSKFVIHIKLYHSHKSPFRWNTDDVDDLRKRILFPVTSVQQLSLTMGLDDRFRAHTRVFDAFFTVCHPIHVKVHQLVLNYNKCFSKLTVREMMENYTTDLKDVLMKNPLTGRWEALTSSWESDFLDTLADTNDVEFKLNWFSHD